MRKDRDPRINSSMPYWAMAAILITTIIFVLVVSATLIAYLENMAAFIPFIITESVAFVLVLMLLLSLSNRYMYQRPMRRIAEAARKVRKGNFSARVQPITKKVGRRTEVDILIEDFNEMVGALSSIETLKTDFIANVSHEIKTPLTIIQSYASALNDESLSPEKRQEYTATILQASKKLSSLITNILKMNKLENQEFKPSPTSFILGEHLRECALAFEEIWSAKNIMLFEEVHDIYVEYDRDMLDLVWSNLISNAVKFTPEGGVIKLKSTLLDNRQIVVSITDNGCGMDEQTRRHIFDKFYQGDSSHSTEGNGLGLSLAQKVLDLLGGWITVESEPGSGSTFHVYLPYRNE